MNIEKRLENLEKLVASLSKKIDNNKFYQDADTASERIGISGNTKDISDTQMGLAETYETTYTAISNVELALTEVYEMIINL